MRFPAHIAVIIPESNAEAAAQAAALLYRQIKEWDGQGSDPGAGFLSTFDDPRRLIDEHGVLYCYTDFACPEVLLVYIPTLAESYGAQWAISAVIDEGQVVREIDFWTWAASLGLTPVEDT